MSYQIPTEATYQPLNSAYERWIAGGLAIYPNAPLNALCAHPVTAEDRKAINLISREGGPMFHRSWLEHHFGLSPNIQLDYMPTGRPSKYTINLR